MSTPAPEKKSKREWSFFCLRVPTDIVAKIDDILYERIGLTKNGWILEAIQEKLKRDT